MGNGTARNQEGASEVDFQNLFPLSGSTSWTGAVGPDTQALLTRISIPPPSWETASSDHGLDLLTIAEIADTRLEAGQFAHGFVQRRTVDITGVDGVAGEKERRCDFLANAGSTCSNQNLAQDVVP